MPKVPACRYAYVLLNRMFDEHQQQALNDYKEASVKIQYNENYRDRKQYG